jgi:hypothetical protein
MPKQTITYSPFEGEDISQGRDDSWPEPMEEAALHGVAGDFIRIIRNSTEADPHAILIALLAGVGCMMGRQSYFTVEATKHHPRLFAVVVGESSRSRKGTATDRVLDLLERVDPLFVQRNRYSGLSSGEGLIHATRDQRVETVEVSERGGPRRAEEQVVDSGVSDKRLFVVESEFASALRCAGREGSILSAILRDAWDGKTLQVLARSNKDRATAPHVSVLGNITLDELKATLSGTDRLNGFGNRFLWVAAKRSKLLPHGGDRIPEASLNGLADRVRMAVADAQNIGEVSWDSSSYAAWPRLYETLTRPIYGLSGALTARAEAQCRRLALIYALLDRSPVIQMEHLRAATAVWSYCEESVRFMFGDSTGDVLADRILGLLKKASTPLSQTDICKGLGGHSYGPPLDRAFQLLESRSLAFPCKASTGGAPKTTWSITCERANYPN